jgi:transcriptional regulator of acetoin/glycerol metabolism
MMSLPPSLDQIPPRAPSTAPTSTDATLERSRLLELLKEHQGNISQIARALSTSRAQVHRLLKRHGLDPRTFQT